VAESVELGTIWLVDLVGSTRVATAVGPVRADELRDEYFALLREAIDTSGGRGFKNTGDGLFVAFSSASAAVSCAVLTQQLFERRYRGADQALHVRIGLGTGESTIQDGDYFGMPSIEAARLCDKAPADGILVSPLTKALAGRVDGARFESVGELELKGIPEPMEAFSVLWEPLDPERNAAGVGRWPLPEALRTAPRIAYVGRKPERGLLEVARAQVRAGERRVVLLSGEPGIGKTRLASYAALAANADGFAVCWGACSEDLAAPYEPWVAVCSKLVEHADADLVEEYVERCGGEIARLAGNLARRLPGAPAPQASDPETERFLLFRAVSELLRAVARAVPLCVVLDDFHWADGQSVALLKHVVRAVEEAAVQFVVTYRDSDLTRDHPLTGALADLRRIDGAERIALAGLGAAEVAEFVGAAAGHELDADGLALAAELATETGGNPFFVAELLRNLTESGAITYDETAARWSVDLAALSSLPESVREVIEHRVDRLGADARETFAIAAVIGRSFDVALLTEIAEVPESLLLDQLEAAVGATLLRESTDQVGQFTFEHALINHTLYQGLGATRRARLHHRVALALESLYGTDAEEHLADLATHWRLASVTIDTAKAAGYSIRAGRHALDSLAPIEAAKLFSGALELLRPQDTVERCEALIGLGEAHRLTADTSYRETLLEASGLASDLEDGERAARAALANSRGSQPSATGQVDHERVAAIERALELDDDPNRRALLLSLQALELVYEHDHHRRQALAEQALDLARETGNPRTTARVLNDYQHVFYTADGLEQRLAHLDEMAAATKAANDPALEFWTTCREHDAMAESGQLERLADATERQVAIAERVGEPAMRHTAAYDAKTCMALLRGDLAAAEHGAVRALQIGTDAGQPDAEMIFGAQIMHVRLLQGRGSEIVDQLEQSVAANPLIPAFNGLLACTLCWLDRRDEAARLVAQAAEDRFEHIPHDSVRTTALALYADAAAQAGETRAAEILCELIEPWADLIVWNGAVTEGHARTYLGLLAAALGRDDLADQHFARAIEIQERGGMLVWAARAHLGWAERLFARGQRNQAREQAQRALELSREHGYGAFEPRAAAILDAPISAGT
jgi:class 3 adenylate cyclase/tetratricopeptide (TPR) repeat protein